ncbi:hypothetical protein CHU95_02755 [Niveispirillum lacus]|uniref:Cobalt transporter n=1 Tax=Niveispirillum lacus TaxID=1981099 RepID=A0A255Z7P4_9PROT|nr:hypothetical protein [Niveispirillum lacus]OYQ36924.1 hypothetical protein CHU95_02755 [Niveispirillum lacus]
MRLLTTLLLLAGFLMNVPGLHARDLLHSHDQTGHTHRLVGVEHPPTSTTGTLSIDCHHGCSHIHVADRVRGTRVVEPVVWGVTSYPVEAPLLPESAEPALPDEPPRA